MCHLIKKELLACIWLEKGGVAFFVDVSSIKFSSVILQELEQIISWPDYKSGGCRVTT